MTADLVKRLRDIPDPDTHAAADVIDQLERELSISRMAQVVMDNTVEALIAERDEALNQLDSARHSVEVLEKRVAKFIADNAQLREATLREALDICDQYEHTAEERDWPDGATQARRIGRRILALINKDKA